jgi:MFS family permease
MHVRLSLLMFLNFTIIGAWVPVLSPFLEQLHLLPEQAAWIFASNALGAILGPIVWGQIADRWLAAEKCICICCLASSASLWFVAGSREPAPIFWGSVAFWMFMIPSLSVGASLTFRHLRNPDREYGRVRLWGTVGWIAVGWVLTAWYVIAYENNGFRVDRADALRLGAICACLTGLYAWTLPHTPPVARISAKSRNPLSLTSFLDAPLRTLALFRHPSFTVLCVCLFLAYMTFTLSSQLTSLLLLKLGVEQAWVPFCQTLAQTTEVLTLASLPVLLVRLGPKGAMVLGLFAWTLALSIFSLGTPRPLVIASLALHGVFITGFVVAAQLHVNRLARDDVRASAQGLMQFINGFGLLSGHFLVGWLRGRVGEDYSQAFLPGAIVAGFVLIFFAVGFQASRPKGEGH